MNWKEFLKPTWKKIALVIGFGLFSSLILPLNNSYILRFFHYGIDSPGGFLEEMAYGFFFIPYILTDIFLKSLGSPVQPIRDFLEDFIPIFSIIIWYLLSCAVIKMYETKEKVRKVLTLNWFTLISSVAVYFILLKLFFFSHHRIFFHRYYYFPFYIHTHTDVLVRPFLGFILVNFICGVIMILPVVGLINLFFENKIKKVKINTLKKLSFLKPSWKKIMLLFLIIYILGRRFVFVYLLFPTYLRSNIISIIPFAVIYFTVFYILSSLIINLVNKYLAGNK